MRRVLISTAVGLLALLAAGFVILDRASARGVVALHASVSVSKTGYGSGRVVSRGAIEVNERAIDCGSSCSGTFLDTTDPAYIPATFSAIPDPGSVFDGWGGSCSGNGGCTIDPVIRLQSYGLTARFSRIPAAEYPVAVGRKGEGRITSTPAGIDCGTTCSGVFKTGSTVALAATPDGDGVFVRWEGACTGSGRCEIKIEAPVSVTAVFSPPSLPLVIARSGFGKVTSNPEGIDCDPTCSAPFVRGSNATLVATPDPGAVFLGWGGACSGGDPTCVLEIPALRSVIARFSGASSHPIVVSVVSGQGSVSSSPAGIACGTACTTTVPAGRKVTLTAAPVDGWAFGGWGGSCAGVRRTCQLTLDSPKAVEATFTSASATSSLVVSTSGNGTVKGSPGAISCPGSCSDTPRTGATILLRATPAVGWTLARWSGDCDGRTLSCELVMDGPRSVSVQFAKAADQRAPRVKALRSGGKAGTSVRLRYVVTEESRRSRENIVVLDGSRQRAQLRVRFHPIDPDQLYSFARWSAPVKLRGKALRFCVTSFDGTGNRSTRSCASVTLT